MNLNIAEMLKKKSWIVEVVFYFALVSLVIIFFSYGIFLFKMYFQNQKLRQINDGIATYGTDQQKQNEKEVFDYRKKIDDFALIMSNHKISSNIFNFIEEKVLANIWFSSFDMSQSTNEMRLSGESENMEILSRQIEVLENSKDYIKNISVLNSQALPSGRIKFVLNLSLTPKIFTYKNPLLSRIQ